MSAVTITPSQTSTGPLVLVNPSHPVRQQPDVGRLAPVCQGRSPILLDRQAAKMLAQLLGFIHADAQIVPVSGYRSLAEQQALFDGALREHGEAFTRQYVAIPGCSEHQTGLAIDVCQNEAGYDPIRPRFPYSGVCQAFREFSCLFGFIERYQAGKEAITQIAQEPWHFRYVGYPHSEVIAENDFSLEEYIDYLDQFPFDGPHLQVRSNRRTYEIFCVPGLIDHAVRVEIPDSVPYQVSGNNRDGCVVTLWAGPG